MLLALGLLLLVGWVFGFFVFHVSSFFIHVLVIAALISVVAHFFANPKTA